MFDQSNEWLIKQYVELGRSPYEIAEELETYPNAVRRQLKKLGIQLRGQDEAQKQSLKRGRRRHPTKGQKRPEFVKEQIGETVYHKYKYKNEDEKKQFVEKIKHSWSQLSKEKKKAIHRKAHKALLTAAKEGSKLEKILVKRLLDKGIEVLYHTKTMVVDSEMHFDVLLPEHGIIIEIDGPQHRDSIFGDKKFNRQQRCDMKKEAQVLANGYKMIRIKYNGWHPREVHVKRLIQRIIELIGTDFRLETLEYGMIN